MQQSRKRLRLDLPQTPEYEGHVEQKILRTSTAYSESTKDGESILGSAAPRSAITTESSVICSTEVDKENDQHSNLTTAPNGFRVFKKGNGDLPCHKQLIGNQCLLHWTYLASGIIRNEMNPLDTNSQPCQIPSSVLVTISNELINLIEWFGIHSAPEARVVEISRSELLSVLFYTTSIVTSTSETATNEDYVLSNDTVTISDKLSGSSDGRWNNPLFARWLFSSTCSQRQLTGFKKQDSITKLGSLGQEEYAPMNHRSFPHFNYSTILVLGVFSLVADLWSELWNRLTRVAALMQAVTNSLLFEEIRIFLASPLACMTPIQSSLPVDSDSSTHDNSGLQSYLRPLLAMHLPSLLNQDFLLLHHAKVPSDLYDVVTTTLQRIKHTNEELNKQVFKFSICGENEVELPGPIASEWLSDGFAPDDTPRLSHTISNPTSNTNSKVRMNIDRYNERWCIKHEKNGRLANTVSFSARHYGSEEAKELLSIAQQETEKTGILPSRDFILVVYETLKDQQHMQSVSGRGDNRERESRNHSSTDLNNEEWLISEKNRLFHNLLVNETPLPRLGPCCSSGKTCGAEREVSEVLFHKATGSCWWDEETAKRRYRYFSAKNYGEKEAKQKAVEEQQKIVSEKNTTTAGMSNSNENSFEDETTELASQGVNFNKRTRYWRARHKDGRSLSFGIKQFGFTGARRLAIFAKGLFDRKNRNISREEVFELYEKKYGALPINQDEHDGTPPTIEDVANDGLRHSLFSDRNNIVSNEFANDEEKFVNNLPVSHAVQRDDDLDMSHDDDQFEDDLYPDFGLQDEDDEIGIRYIDYKGPEKVFMLFTEDPEASRNQSGVIGVTFNTSKRLWSAKLSVSGNIRSCNWASGKYGHDVAKQLAIIAKKEGDRLGYFPPRESILEIYDGSKHGRNGKILCPAFQVKAEDHRNMADNNVHTLTTATQQDQDSEEELSNKELEQMSLALLSKLVMQGDDNLFMLKDNQPDSVLGAPLIAQDQQLLIPSPLVSLLYQHRFEEDECCEPRMETDSNLVLAPKESQQYMNIGVIPGEAVI